MFLAALVLPAAIATTELRAVYCLTVLKEKARIHQQLGQPSDPAPVQRLRSYLGDVRIGADETARAARQAMNDAAEAGMQKPDQEAMERLKSCDSLDWLR